MNKMKTMPGMGNIQSMLSKMGMSGLGGGKMNMNAMEANLNQRMKIAKTKDRIRAKAEANAKARMEQQSQPTNIEQQPAISEEELLKLFSSTEKAERTPRGSKPQTSNEVKKKKEKKGKK
jgi:hypothetical protein